ncbi:MAG TPA: M28 family peptidase [Gemmatimonadaceae bacterium]|nr:M28 family peptidase [Gemmatimonadaceae bacterium]
MTTLCVLLAVALQGGACGRGEATVTSPFDGERALGYARTFMDFGPRVPGTDAHKRAGDWIASEMRQRADTVIEQTWTHTTQSGVKLPLRNVLARFNPMAEERLLYVTHWDSRPVADKSTTDSLRKLPTPGANDGGSGVALFLALGDVLKATPPGIGVDLLFVDGEDYGQFAPDVDVLLGSMYFANNLPSANYRPLFGVVWDMIGEADLRIPQEEYSVTRAPEVVERVWRTAADMGYGNVFVPATTYGITDDHLPLLDKGLRVIDVIDLEYAHHHTVNDTIDKLSARSLKIVGDVAWKLIQR